MKIPLAEQIKCVERELALRRSAYPKWVAIQRMTQTTADRELAAMAAVLETLKALKVEREPSLLDLASDPAEAGR
jgi:hypothetical protein